jgi:multicomponent Na+:H+ antiporter subunit G
MTILDFLSGVLLLAGCSLGVIGAIGLLRFPDFYTRMHAAGVTDTLCAGLFFGGLAIQFGFTLASAKLLLIFLFMLFTCPTSTHALAKAARHGGLQPWTKAGSDALNKLSPEGAKPQ